MPGGGHEAKGTNGKKVLDLDSHQAVCVDKNASEVYRGGGAGFRIDGEDLTSLAVSHDQNATVVVGLANEK